MREFAEQEIRLPNGPHVGRRFSLARNPFNRLWFDAIDSGLYQDHYATGPTGSGKTLTSFIIPIMFHLFEVVETTLCGLPSLDMVNDKWLLEIQPVIEASRYKEFLPTKGAGSRGGKLTSITFRNGVTLRFMSGGGGDKARAGFHCRPLIVTETDGFDEVGGTSREADKLTQLIRRTSSYGDLARRYFECTASTEAGRTWREYQGGTKSRIAVGCPHCRKYVTPEREHLVGWRDAPDVIAAAADARLICPSCGVAWSEDDRHAANADCRLVHKGQAIDDAGVAVGEAPRTTTLGFRWTAANNLLVKIGHVAAEEWTASKEPDEENAEKKMRQFVWALPHLPDKVDVSALQAIVIAGRTHEWPRSVVPPDARALTLGVDLGSWLFHWTLIAWRDSTPHVVDHGRHEVPRDDKTAPEISVLLALRTFRDDIVAAGWPVGTIEAANKMRPTLTLIDSGWATDVVYGFCTESGPQFLPVKGFGVGQLGDRRQTGTKIVAAGDGYDLAILPGGQHLIEAKADRWKAFVHARAKTPVGQPGGLTLFVPGQGEPKAHMGFANHLVAERQVEKYDPEKGLVTLFERLNRNNHWLDSTSLSMLGGHIAGVRLIQPAAQPTPVARPRPDRPEWMPDRPDDLLTR